MTLSLRPRTALPTVLLLGVGLLAGCSGGSGGSSSARETDAAVSKDVDQSGTPQSVDCPGKAVPVDLPAGLNPVLPAGTVVVAVQQRAGGRTVITGVVPKPEADVLKELQSAYKAAGLTLTEGETEEHDAESNFTGSGVTGRWGIRSVSECSPEATRIDLVVGKV